MATIEDMKAMITKVIQLFEDDEEFDTGKICKVMKSEYGFTYPTPTVRNILKGMTLQRRRLTKEETEKWRRKHGTQPKIVYRRHLGKDPNNYPSKGVGSSKKKRQPHPQDKIQKNDDECGLCPDMEECWIIGDGCIREPNRKVYNGSRVYKLEDFET